MAQNNSMSAKPPRSLPASRSVFSRLTSPFSARARTVSEFYIKLEEPYRQYFPGDSLKGSVNLTVPKHIRVTHLVVCLHGFIRVSKNGNTAAEDAGDTPNAGRSKRPGESLGNGCMPLFADEVVLSGEGKLEPGMYRFEFILEFPGGALPSSIDFERGTISYMVTSTLTRPTTISPVTHCNLKVRFTKPIDIARIHPPLSRIVTLEPIPRRSRGKGPSMRDSGHREKITVAHDDPISLVEVPEPSSLRNSGEQQIPPHSPAPSEVSGESAVSSSTGSLSFRLAPAPSIARTSRRSNTQGSVLSLADKTITATVELLRGGYLRGDTVPVRVSINHTKCVKSLHGIIITLYRQGRIDSCPLIPLPLNKSKEADKAKHEDYYPKTRTGLGGLSLSAGSSSVYRKDLAQTFAPLIIDPRTLSAVVTASVRVPEDAFPTITSVPGGMVDFKYFVEVVIDLGGKLAGQDRILPRIGLVSMCGVEEGSTNMLAAWGGGVVETDHIRREKSVVNVQFEIVVGTKDSARGLGKRMEIQRQPQGFDGPELDAMPSSALPLTLECLQHRSYMNGHEYHTPENLVGHEEPYAHWEHSSYIGPQIPIDVPPPEIAEPDGMDEKTRLQILEATLLPSAPPEDEQGSSSAPIIQGPSAPVIPLPVEHGSCGEPEVHHGQFHMQSIWALPSHHLHMSYLRPSAPPIDTVGSLSHSDHHPGSVPQPGQLTTHTNEHPPTDDKYDLERRRLQTEASAPEYFAEDDHQAGQNAIIAANSESADPTAPVLAEDGEYGFHGPILPENLPRYER